MDRAERNIKWIENYCKVPDGQFVGKPLKLRPFQKDIIREIYNNPKSTRRAIISFGRKNGKTTLVAILLLLHLCGPEARPNSELYSTALSRDQAAITFRLAAKVVRLSPELSSFVSIRDTIKELYCAKLHTIYAALSADASTAMGKSPVFSVHDELGQVRGPRHSLYEALETATAAHESPLSVIISTQAPTDGDLLSILIDDAKADHDERTKLFLYCAPENCDPFHEDTIKLANPAYGDFQNKQEVLDMALAAKRMPSREAEYRNLILNQRVEAASPLIAKSVWQANAGKENGWGIVYGGLDLSETNDLTALVLVSPVEGMLNVRPVFWLPGEGLIERARRDRVPYDVWADRGLLKTVPGRSVEYSYVAEYVTRLFSEMNIRKIAFDRYNMRHFRPWLVKSGLSEDFIDTHFEDFGQGYVSMSPAVRTLETMLLNEKILHGGHPVLTMCAANAVTKKDEAGNRKLDKKRAAGRIDGIVALAMAASAAEADLDEGQVYPVPLEQILA